MGDKLKPLLLAIVVLPALALSWSEARAADDTDSSGEKTMNDFGFLPGKTLIRHRRLKESMAGSDEWITFDTGYEAWTMLDGAASIDRVFGEIDGEPFEGLSVRTYDRETGEWTIYWTDSWNTTLREQVRGRFEGDVGTFYGKEEYRGVTYRMRFLWKDITDTTARWEQAYQHPETGEWETNWTMDFYEDAE